MTRVRPEAAQAFDDALKKAYAADPDGLLELCAARVRTLLGGTVTSDDPRLQAVGDYARSELFNKPNGSRWSSPSNTSWTSRNMPDDLVAALHERLGTEGLYAFAMGLYAIDQAERLAVSAAVHPGATR